jgi:hypothetical protein
VDYSDDEDDELPRSYCEVLCSGSPISPSAALPSSSLVAQDGAGVHPW